MAFAHCVGGSDPIVSGRDAGADRQAGFVQPSGRLSGESYGEMRREDLNASAVAATDCRLQHHDEQFVFTAICQHCDFCFVLMNRQCVV